LLDGMTAIRSPQPRPDPAPNPAPDRRARSAARAAALRRLGEAERRWSGPIPSGVLALARAGSAAMARAAKDATERRSLDRTADGLRRAMAGRRRRLPAQRAPTDPVLATQVADLCRWRAVAVGRIAFSQP
jgi:hypothetical protein